MTTIYLIRHGIDRLIFEKKHNGWAKNNPLSPSGIKQVKNSSAKLKNKGISKVFSSDIQRAKDSAKIISQFLGVPIEIDTRLRDQRRSAKMEGMHYTKFLKLKSYKLWQAKKHLKNFKLPDGESTNELNKRTSSFAKELEKRYLNEVVLLVTHNVTIASLVEYWTKTELKKEEIDFASVFRIKNGKLTRIA